MRHREIWVLLGAYAVGSFLLSGSQFGWYRTVVNEGIALVITAVIFTPIVIARRRRRRHGEG